MTTRPRHSPTLKNGVANTLGLLSFFSKLLNNVTHGKSKDIVKSIVLDVLLNASWELWASLNHELPYLAESSPTEFLDAVEDALYKSESPFERLFLEHENNSTGFSFYGLFWALEVLAWDEVYLTRVTLILGEICEKFDLKGQSSSAIRSLTEIYLPWYPHTLASPKKRMLAMNALIDDSPKVSWLLLLSLLPQQNQISKGTHKPKWNTIISEDYKISVTKKEYIEQISLYSNMILKLAMNNQKFLLELIPKLNKLPSEQFNKAIDYLKSNEISKLKESDRTQIWEKLVELITKHKRFSSSAWAMKSEIVTQIELIADEIGPNDLLLKYKRLFTIHDSNLYEEKGNWQEQDSKLRRIREIAVNEIYAEFGIDGLVKFSSLVNWPQNVGQHFGAITEGDIDGKILPDLLKSKIESTFVFACGFVRGRYYSLGWDWVDSFEFESWDKPIITEFLKCLPFTSNTWDRAKRLLKKTESSYWKTVDVRPFQENNEQNLYYAVDKLMAVHRVNEAIECLYQILNSTSYLDCSKAAKVLVSALSSSSKASYMDSYNIKEIIAFIQRNHSLIDEVIALEWAYLNLFEYYEDLRPENLEKALSNSPQTFMDVIKLAYRSNKESNFPTGDHETAIAMNAYRLLDNWRAIPGTDIEGNFSEQKFETWFNEVKKLSSESGHLEVALLRVGNVLIYSPEDSTGFWLNFKIARALNGKDAGPMRDGYRTAIFNSRGAHWIDPTAEPELELSSYYNQLAVTTEEKGFHRLALTLNDLAESYKREAENILAGRNFLNSMISKRKCPTSSPKTSSWSR